MSSRGSMLAFLAILPLTISGNLCGARQEYIQISTDNVNIRAEPTTRSEVIGKARKGNVFELEGQNAGWYQIHLFSGESRYVHRSLASLIQFQILVPQDISIRKQIYRAWIQIGERAQKEADDRFSPDRDLARNLEYSRILQDRYRLELMQEFEVQPPAYRRIILEGNQNGW